MKKRWIGGVAATGALLAGAGAVLYASQVERADVQLDRFTVEVDRPGLPPGGIVVLHLSDFHFRAGGRVQARKIARLKQLLANERYDIVALTGDLIHDAAGFPAALSLIETLRPPMGAFSCRGNHDYAEYSVWGVFGHTGRGSGDTPGLSVRNLVEAARKLVDFARKVLHNELVRLPVAFNDMAAMDAGLISAGVRPLVNTAVQVPGADLWVAGVDDSDRGGPGPAHRAGRRARRAAGDPAGAQPGHLAECPRGRGRSRALGPHPRRPGAAAGRRGRPHPGHASQPPAAGRLVRTRGHAHVRQPRPG